MRTPNIAQDAPARKPLWFSLPDVARRLRLPTDRVLSLVRTNQVRGRLVGGRRWFVHADELARFRQRYRCGSGGRAA